MKADAVFVIWTPDQGKTFAAVSRPGQIGDKIFGFPGGCVEAGEDEIDALMREANEEGWAIDDILSTIIFEIDYNDKHVHWYAARSALKLYAYQEKPRGIYPCCIDAKYLTAYHNQEAIKAWRSKGAE